MKKSILFELKRIALPLCLFTAIATALYAAVALTTDYIGSNFYSPEHAINTLTYIPAIILCILCVVTPALQFSYRMNKRSTDLWYALPIRRKNLLFVRFLCGFVLILIPYTVSYFLGFTIIACSENLFDLVWYVPLYFASLPAALCLFGINSFCFTRANTVFDGVLFMIALNVAPFMPYLFLYNNFHRYLPALARNSLNYLPIGAPIQIFTLFDTLILGATAHVSDNQNLILSCSICAAMSAAAYFGLFYTADKHKAENAGQISDSWFGYKILIPWYLFFSIADASSPVFLFFDSIGISLVQVLLIFVCALIAYFVYRRSFLLKKSDWLCLLLTFAASILCLFLLQNVFLPMLS